ncbi:hypothetical protein M8037_32400 [Sinorhizobium meliloti]|uniref:hypothetical protein n=2 Tax=Rhizobium meliloti TaxID=382 RepID=UPI0020732959|nr:hypothetical protein [Sinorhizobium meliloti]MCM5693363.1 hypothetical protein [Sinorhizobium meliloti]
MCVSRRESPFGRSLPGQRGRGKSRRKPVFLCLGSKECLRYEQESTSNGYNLDYGCLRKTAFKLGVLTLFETQILPSILYRPAPDANPATMTLHPDLLDALREFRHDDPGLRMFAEYNPQDMVFNRAGITNLLNGLDEFSRLISCAMYLQELPTFPDFSEH